MSSWIPGQLYVDSGILIGAVIAGSHHSAAASEFCERVAFNGSRIFFSQIARYELAHLAWCLASPQDRRQLPGDIVQQYSLEHWETNLLVRQRWFDAVNRKVDELLSQFQAVFEIPIRAHHWDRALNLMAYYNLRSYDALHVATAQMLDLRDFATCDRHFESVDDLVVILVRDTN